ncbi:MAG: nucleoside hydrolase [Spirochaetia bacterium]|jgi:inosine-uridine nucleoside N-ribohydrolase|nr:nucleoside hydrolase [Spirochaetia bacterium]
MKVEVNEAQRLQKLKKPKGKVDVVLDTDTYNEIDDQYALSFLVKSSDKLNLKALYAAPFSNKKAATPAEGMQKSFDEIFNILTLLERDDLKKITFKGSENYLSNENTPIYSPAAEDLARRAMDYSEENPLYVIAIAAITNVASAILINPEIINHIVVVWLGGNALHWPTNREFNLFQDIAGARIIFGCGVPLIMLPCLGVVSSFRTTGPELNYHLKGKNKLCDYLVDVTEKEALLTYGRPTWSRAIWDVTAVAWLLDGDYMDDCLITSPIPEYDDKWGFDCTRHQIRYVFNIKRDNLFEELFRKLAN